ncbi:MAG: ATP-binding protein [Verrucomicrobiota bacterium]
MLEELSLHILDIGMNSLAAGAKNLEVTIIENTKRDWLIIRIRDDGHGMDEQTLQAVLDHRVSSRNKKIGLGLAFLQQTSEMCGGTFHVNSLPGKGTTVTASMRLAHIDRPPLGDLNGTISTLCANPKVNVHLHYRADDQTFHFSSQEEGKPNEPRRTQETQRKDAATSLVA